MKTWTKWLAYGTAVLLLLAVFSFYTRPDFLLTLANEIWACF